MAFIPQDRISILSSIWSPPSSSCLSLHHPCPQLQQWLRHPCHQHLGSAAAIAVQLQELGADSEQLIIRLSSCLYQNPLLLQELPVFQLAPTAPCTSFIPPLQVLGAAGWFLVWEGWRSPPSWIWMELPLLLFLVLLLHQQLEDGRRQRKKWWSITGWWAKKTHVAFATSRSRIQAHKKVGFVGSWSQCGTTLRSAIQRRRIGLMKPSPLSSLTFDAEA